ncbi:hypothetical protein [Streptomyces sp. Agncl-13]|uniref:hypothetical protein n=1 Tax=Streptomyces sp. Agncl-13 TaxID=3400628 RepID=UPI003A8AA006
MDDADFLAEAVSDVADEEPGGAVDAADVPNADAGTALRLTMWPDRRAIIPGRTALPACGKPWGLVSIILSQSSTARSDHLEKQHRACVADQVAGRAVLTGGETHRPSTSSGWVTSALWAAGTTRAVVASMWRRRGDGADAAWEAGFVAVCHGGFLLAVRTGRTVRAQKSTSASVIASGW